MNPNIQEPDVLNPTLFFLASNLGWLLIPIALGCLLWATHLYRKEKTNGNSNR